MSIPISSIVRINPGVLSAAGSAVDLNGLILTQDTAVPIGTVKSFVSAADVGAFFGLTSTEYRMAQTYFAGFVNCTKTPGLLYFAQYNPAAVAGYMRGANLGTMTLNQLKALSGVLTVSVDGVAKTSSSITLAAATSFANAATIIQSAFTSLGGTVTYDQQRNAFKFTSSTTGLSSSVGFATGTLSAGLMLTSATGAVTSAGAAIATPATFMPGIIAITQNWALFTTTWESLLAEKQAFSDWTATVAPRFGYVGMDSDVNALTLGSTATWGYYLQSGDVSGSIPVFGDVTATAFVLGFAASLDFDRLNGRATAAFKQGSNVTQTVVTQAAADALKGNGYNYYGNYATANDQFVFFYPGSVSGIWTWLDSYLNQIWLNANLQYSIINLMVGVTSIPYNSDGYALIHAACQDPIEAAVNFGAIRRGVVLSQSQKAQMQSVLGVDVSAVMSEKGWYLQIQPATAAIRAARSSPVMTLYYMDGGSIHSVTLASIEVQ